MPSGGTTLRANPAEGGREASRCFCDAFKSLACPHCGKVMGTVTGLAIRRNWHEKRCRNQRANTQHRSPNTRHPDSTCPPHWQSATTPRQEQSEKVNEVAVAEASPHVIPAENSCQAQPTNRHHQVCPTRVSDPTNLIRPTNVAELPLPLPLNSSTEAAEALAANFPKTCSINIADAQVAVKIQEAAHGEQDKHRIQHARPKPADLSQQDHLTQTSSSAAASPLPLPSNATREGEETLEAKLPKPCNIETADAQGAVKTQDAAHGKQDQKGVQHARPKPADLSQQDHLTQTSSSAAASPLPVPSNAAREGEETPEAKLPKPCNIETADAQGTVKTQEAANGKQDQQVIQHARPKPADLSQQDHLTQTYSSAAASPLPLPSNAAREGEETPEAKLPKPCNRETADAQGTVKTQEEAHGKQYQQGIIQRARPKPADLSQHDHLTQTSSSAAASPLQLPSNSAREGEEPLQAKLPKPCNIDTADAQGTVKTKEAAYGEQDKHGIHHATLTPTDLHHQDHQTQNSSTVAELPLPSSSKSSKGDVETVHAKLLKLGNMDPTNAQVVLNKETAHSELDEQEIPHARLTPSHRRNQDVKEEEEVEEEETHMPRLSANSQMKLKMAERKAKIEKCSP